MWRQIIIICMMLVMPFAVYAEGEVISGPGVVADTATSNRFLAAENAKAIEKMKQELIEALIKNNDDNVRILDQRMIEIENRTRQRVIVGGVGAILVANALIGMIYVWVTRRYSYEHFLERLLQRKVPEMKVHDAMPPPAVVPPTPGQIEASSPVWQQPTKEETVSTFFGQQVAANMSDMNQWQFTPAYEGAWQRPGNVVSEVTWEQVHKGYEAPKNPWEQGGGY